MRDNRKGDEVERMRERKMRNDRESVCVCV